MYRNLILCFFISIIFVPITMAGEPVHFHDQRLKTAVEEKLGVSNPTSADMLNLTELNVGLINNLIGLEHAKNLSSLRIIHQKPLIPLDITVLSSLTNLHTLSLAYCSIEDISALSSLVNLRSLDLTQNQIGDLSALSSLVNLSTLDLGVNHRVKDVSPLSAMKNLTNLNLHNNRVSDISPLASLINLKYLSLGSNGIRDISALSSLVKLERLQLGWNQIRDITPLSSLTKLMYLNLVSNRITDVSALSSLTGLKDLNLYGNQIRDISPLSSLENLTTLSLRFNFVTDISPLSLLTRLQSVDLKNNPWYFRQFLLIALGASAVFSIVGLAIYLYLKKTRKDKPKVCLLIKLALACCVVAPLLCWFCLDFLGDVLSKQAIYRLSDNLPLSLFFIISPSVAVLIAGIWASVVALRNIKQGNTHPVSKKPAVIALIGLSVLVFICGFYILIFIGFSVFRHPYY